MFRLGIAVGHSPFRRVVAHLTRDELTALWALAVPGIPLPSPGATGIITVEVSPQDGRVMTLVPVKYVPEETP